MACLARCLTFSQGRAARWDSGGSGSGCAGAAWGNARRAGGGAGAAVRVWQKAGCLCKAAFAGVGSQCVVPHRGLGQQVCRRGHMCLLKPAAASPLTSRAPRAASHLGGGLGPAGLLGRSHVSVQALQALSGCCWEWSGHPCPHSCVQCNAMQCIAIRQNDGLTPKGVGHA